ncbi:glycosyltransferase [Nocardioides caricicola]|uniref:Glycosyltransferase n=1 Tax=Nocardioides caricicola TaxID=634770 RepID=A0ABW0N4N2_9ACTN
MVSSVSVLLVSHDGGRWLPAVIDGLRAQRTPVDAVVCVDTGSKDESADLLDAAFAADFGAALRVSGSTSFPEAVRLGLERLRLQGSSSEWVWILHDDANPDPGALAALLAAAAADPGADVLGPKLREWPSLRRLLELGVTISGTGRRETGLERGEYDQGQHDEVREVLAVNTAGMLVRRTVLEELGGFDAQLPIFGNDIDFGWRAAAAGHRTLIVPEAVVFHAEAAHRGVRRTPLTGRHTHYQERRAALYTLLANARGRALPWLVVRLAFGTVLRMLGFLVVRSPGEALDDLAALLNLYAHPGQVRAARRARREQRPAEEHARSLLSPWWVPYRHGLDFLGDLAAAATNQAQDVAERRRVAAAAVAPASTVARPRTDEDELVEDTGIVARFLTNPVALTLAAFVLVALVGARDAFDSLAGGGLSPAPASAGQWWQLQVETWHPLGTGTAVPAPAYVLPMALLATLLGGSPSLAVSLVMLLAVPFGLWGAWRFLRVVGRLVTPTGAPRTALLWGATTWALVPVVSGAWSDGRFGVVVVAATLPWLAHAALGFADPAPDRRWRAAWRTGLLLALASAFAPVLWLFAALLGLVVVVAAFLIVRGAVRDRSVWGPPATALALVPALLSPWWVPAVQRGAAEAFLLDVGRLPSPVADGLDLATGRLAGLGAPWWTGAILAVLALLALVPRSTRIPVLVCWVVALVAAVLAALLGTGTLALAATTVATGLAALVVVLQGAFVVAATIGAIALVHDLHSWRRAVAAVVAVAAAVVPLGGLAWWLGAAENTVADGVDTDIPVYMVESSEQGPEHGILVVRGSVDEGLTYSVRRGDGVTMGEDEILALTSEDEDFTAQVRELVSRPTPEVIDALGQSGIEYVVLPEPADGGVAGVLDAATGLIQASAIAPTRAWEVDRPLDAASLEGPTSWLRVALLVLAGLGTLVVVVLCLPTTSRRRS